MRNILNYKLFDLGKDNPIYLSHLLLFILALVVTFFVIRLVSYVIKYRLNKRGKLDGRTQSIIQLTKYILWVLGISFSIHLLGIDVTFIIASSAALLVGIGLGLQNIFKDFMCGIVILVEGTIKINDVVEIDGEVVRIKYISLRTTEVFTRSFNTVLVPNHKFIEEKVTNWSHNEEPTRFKLKLSVHYDTDINLMKDIVMEVVLGNKNVIKTNRFYPFIRFTEYGASSLDFELYFWSENLFLIENVKSDLRFQILDEFRKNNIEIPYQQIVLHKV